MKHEDMCFLDVAGSSNGQCNEVRNKKKRVVERQLRDVDCATGGEMPTLFFSIAMQSGMGILLIGNRCLCCDPGLAAPSSSLYSRRVPCLPFISVYFFAPSPCLMQGCLDSFQHESGATSGSLACACAGTDGRLCADNHVIVHARNLFLPLAHLSGSVGAWLPIFLARIGVVLWVSRVILEYLFSV